jgi:hypothetical protein
MMVLKYCENYENVTQRHKVNTYYWKNGADKLNQCRVATKISTCISIIKSNAIKCVMLVHRKISNHMQDLKSTIVVG